MKSLLWISLLLGVLLFAQGVPVDEKNPDDGYQDDQDGDSDDDDENPPIGPPPVLKSKNKSFSVVVGDSVMLPCHVENPVYAVIMWWLGSSILYTGDIPTSQAKERSNIQLLSNFSLSIHNIQEADIGQYRCEVISSRHKIPVSTVHYFVGSTMKPHITQLMTSQPKNIVQKGSSITLTCTASGSPPPKITFTKKTRHGSQEDPLDGPTLTLESVTRKNSGLYQCRAENEQGFDTQSIEVHVHFKPEVEAVKDFVNIDEGYDAELLCIVHSEPKAEVEWYKESTKLDNDEQVHQQNDKRKHSLRLQAVKASDFGTYKCAATNSLGTTMKTIEVSGRPSKPIFQSVNSSSTDNKSPELKWKVESINHISEYELLYRMQDASEWKTAIPQLEQHESPRGVYTVRHVLSGLQEAHTYQAQLRAKNGYGWSPLSDPHSFSAKSERKDQAAAGSGAAELRISFALISSILIARFYC
ncbi:opioid-binding protein/cell adhesion molecule homolog isoform X3 [Nilaparvata lugens]|uniref:opioid-binding protein/cell adhesion molecule homolog isoform X3 n=1 Tax=Nilaparvata lugens TaxID=108931 RepID=UPI00193E86D2|nr:opioid-binding protein/cell adhesion molecule homolog isoform X3 [Nilaparvata lugens]